ncbi:immunoglobulin superfamily member 6 [Lates japonicus]|nr:immunoglobulin superfamily member 6 [Lates japonicus]
MDRLFWFSLLLTHLPVTDSCLTQPEKEMWRKTGQDALLPCNASSQCSTTGFHFEWFVFKETSHHHLNVNGNKDKYSLEGASLRIKSLNTNDSGIYHCAAASPGESESRKPHVGTGTSLTVRGAVKTMARHILLWLSFVLLVIYSIAVVTLIILKKYRCNTSFCRRMCKTDKNYSTRKIQFRDVLQEMNNRRSFKRSKQTADKDSSHVEAANDEFNSSIDGIYQNI